MMHDYAMYITLYTGSLIVELEMLYSALRMNAKTKELSKFTRLLYVYTAGALCALIMTFTQGRQWTYAHTVMELAGLLAYLLLAYGSPLFISYLCGARRSDFSHVSLRSVLLNTIYILSAVMVLFNLINLYTGWIYAISADNRILPGRFFTANECIVMIQMVLMMILVAIHPNIRLKKHDLWLIAFLLFSASALSVFKNRTGYLYPIRALSLLLVYANVHLENEHIIRQNEIELRQNRLSFLIGQIQPHFVFNVLNTIYYLCDTDSETALQATRNFRLFLENSIQNTDAKETVPFEEELEYVTHYTDLEKLRFDQIEIIHDIRTSDFRIPPLTVQPLVENAIRHGLRETERGTVIISAYRDADGYVVEVKDDGIGYVDRPKNDGRRHVGIENVRNRLSIISGAKLSIEALHPRGTCARITIPYTEKGYQRAD